MSSKVLSFCEYLKEDDFSYLIDEIKWVRRLTYRIAPEEMKDKIVPILKVLINDLKSHQEKLDLIIEKVFSRGAEHTYLIEIKLTDLDFNQRKEIESCFVATIIRHLILKTPEDQRDTTKAREEFRKRLTEEGGEVSYFDIMQEETGSDMELTCLFRFERAVLIAKSYISGNRNKGLFLSVGSLLEGSDDFTKYITGGHASKETKRRVMMIERLCGIQPRKRVKKLNKEEGSAVKHSKMEDTTTPSTLAGGSLPVLADAATRAPQMKDFSAFGFRVVEVEEENTVYGQYKAVKNVTSSSMRIKSYNRGYESLFEREVELMKKLNQRDCIVQMVGFSEEWQGVERLIIYEDGYDRRISELVGANPSIIIRALIDVMEAVQFVHSHEIVVKNLKPETIYLAGPLHNMRAKLGDFTHAEKVTSAKTMEWTMPEAGDDENKMEVVEPESERPEDKNSETWKVEKEEVEGRLEGLLLKDSLFVAPELFIGSSEHRILDYKSDVWSLGLLSLFLLKRTLPWKEIEFIQESIDGKENECNEVLNGLIARLTWEDEDGDSLKDAIASSLQIPLKDRISLLELRSFTKDCLRQRKLQKVKQEIIVKESPFVQSLTSFTTSIRAVEAVAIYEKMNFVEENSMGKSTTNAVVTPDLLNSSSAVATAASGKYKRLFRIAGKAVIAMNRFQTPASVPHRPYTTADQVEKTLLNGRFSIIFTLQRAKDYNTHIVQNIRTGRKQIIKQIRSKNVQYDNEVNLLRSLKNNASIIELEEYMEDMYHKYMVLDWLDDGCLINVLNEYDTMMSEKCVQSVAKSLISAVEFLHSKGYIHRGLNLSRILVKRTNQDEMRIKVWDFETAIMKEGGFGYGHFPLASIASSSMFQSPTATWMHYPEDEGEEGYYCLAPEILYNLVYPEKKVSYNEKVDHWSVGIILYMLIEGKSCFAVRGARAIYEDIEKWSGEVRVARTAGKSADEAIMEMLPFQNKGISGEAKSVIGSLMREEAKERIMFRDVRVQRWLKIEDVSKKMEGSYMASAGGLPSAPLFIPSSSGSIQPQHILSAENASMFPDLNGCFKPYFGGMTSMPLLTSGSMAIPPMPFPTSLGMMTSNPMLTDTSVGRGLNPTPPQVHQQPVNFHELVKELFQDKVFSKFESYMKYLEYQKAIEDDDFDKADQLQKEFLELDATFKPEYEDEGAFKAAYQDKLNKLGWALAEFKREVTKNPLLFPCYKEYIEQKTFVMAKGRSIMRR